MIIEEKTPSLFVAITKFGNAILTCTLQQNDITQGHIHIIISFH